MTVRITEDRTQDFYDRLQGALEKTAIAYGQQVQAIFVEKRLWPPGFGTTYRRNGEVITGPYRNIYDLGNAAKSQRMEIEQFQASFSWDGNGETPMVVVHEGAQLWNGGVIPPRPFTEVAAIELDIPRTFAEEFNASR